VVKVKICGITNLEDARLAVENGADLLGFNFYQRSPRYIAPGAARDIESKLRSEFAFRTFGVFVNEPLESVLQITVDSNVDAIQLHGDETVAYFEQAHDYSSLAVVKAFRVNDETTEQKVSEYWRPYLKEFYDLAGVLLDGYSPAVYGGSGEVADWDLARRLSADIPRVYLAGGLNPENVADAVRMVRPYAVDVASGVESSPGQKDPKKLEAFIKNAKNA
jgi:phosphoribosylanthranilate isomerase